MALDPADSLRALAGELRDEDSVISPHVAEPAEGVEPALGLLVAAGPRAAGHEGDYALVVEALREGYLLHYGAARIVRGADADLALLGGDYLYALGLERLAALGDLEAVRELSDLISLSAQLHAEGRTLGVPEALWLASVTATACGTYGALADAKAALREGRPEAEHLLAAAARLAASAAGIEEDLERAAEAINSRPVLRG